MQDKRFLGLMDMIDGGGMGRAGSEFEGGPLSGLLNALGIRPQGYADRMEEQEAMSALLPRPAPTASPMQDRSTEELVAMIEAALGRSSYADMQKNVYAPGAVTTRPSWKSNRPTASPRRISGWVRADG